MEEKKNLQKNTTTVIEDDQEKKIITKDGKIGISSSKIDSRIKIKQNLGKFLEKKKEMDNIYLKTQGINNTNKQKIILGIINNLDIENINKRWEKLTERFKERSKDLNIPEGHKLVEDFEDIDKNIAKFGETIEDEKVKDEFKNLKEKFADANIELFISEELKKEPEKTEDTEELIEKVEFDFKVLKDKIELINSLLDYRDEKPLNNKYIINYQSNKESDKNNQNDTYKNLKISQLANKNSKSSKLAYKNFLSSHLNTKCLSPYQDKNYDIFYKKYYKYKKKYLALKKKK